MQNNIIITLFISLISIGNLARIIPLPIKFGNISLIEILLYLEVVFYAITQNGIRKFISRYCISIFLLLLSGMMGIVKFGLDFKALAYLIRLLLMILSGYCVCQALYSKFRNQWENVFYLICCGYLANIIVGYLLLLFFPDSVQLWTALTILGIEFKGDPHQTRFISTYLDPNFYGTIACIPLIISFYLWRNNSHKNFSGLMIVILVITELFTLSRSGIVTFAIVTAVLLREDLWQIVSKMKIKKSVLIFSVLITTMIPIFSFYNLETVIRLVERFEDIENDPSALHRWDSLMEGLDILSEHLLFGTGYNFTEQYDVLIDSSVILLLISFGLIIFFAFVIIFFLYSWNILYRNRIIEKTHFYYLLVVVFFSSWFNQILTYPYWLIPYMSIAMYLNKIYRSRSDGCK